MVVKVTFTHFHGFHASPDPAAKIPLRLGPFFATVE
jgi:hypothetical protein